MCSQRRRPITIATSVAIIIGMAVAASWYTTSCTWDGMMPKGEWTILVKDEAGNPVVGASVTLVSSETGAPLANDGRRSYGCFDNYTNPGSVTSGPDGSIHLRNTRDLPTGGEYWDLFWCWPIGDDGTSEWPVLWIAAPGYESTTVSIETLCDEKEMRVTLRE